MDSSVDKPAKRLIIGTVVDLVCMAIASMVFCQTTKPVKRITTSQEAGRSGGAEVKDQNRNGEITGLQDRFFLLAAECPP